MCSWKMLGASPNITWSDMWLGFHFSLRGVWRRCREAVYLPLLAFILHIVSMQIDSHSSATVPVCFCLTIGLTSLLGWPNEVQQWSLA